LTTLDAAAGETSHAWPSFMADGRHVVFFVNTSQPGRAGIWVTSIDDPAQRRKVIDADAQPVAVGNVILYLRDLALMAQPIDPVTLDPSGRSMVAGINVGRGPLGQVFATASDEVLMLGAPGSALRQPVTRWDAVRIAG
jgi:hypothetical protein